MDEMPEFQQHVLESLRQPLEDGRIAIARAGRASHFPARFQLVAAANPCRRGCPSLESCLCTPADRARYLGRLSGPLLDRIDLHVELPALTPADYATEKPSDGSGIVRARVIAARARQAERFGPAGPRGNAEMSARDVRRWATPPRDAVRLLDAATERLGLSARGRDRVLKIARTIADLAAARTVTAEHCAEAIQYRGLDRGWRP